MSNIIPFFETDFIKSKLSDVARLLSVMSQEPNSVAGRISSLGLVLELAINNGGFF